MMKGYFNQPGQTAAAGWYDAAGNRFIRTGDVARFDAAVELTTELPRNATGKVLKRELREQYSHASTAGPAN